jgi:hypothetical protein
MLAVNQLMIKLTGFSIHSKKNTLSALVSDEMCDYGIFKMNLLVNGMLQEQRVFRINRICDASLTVCLTYFNTLFLYRLPVLQH